MNNPGNDQLVIAQTAFTCGLEGPSFPFSGSTVVALSDSEDQLGTIASVGVVKFSRGVPLHSRRPLFPYSEKKKLG